MIRASEIYNILTNRIEFNIEEYKSLVNIVKNKVEKNLKEEFNLDNIEKYKNTRGLITDAKKLHNLVLNRLLLNELPQSAKNYLEGVYLEKHGFYHSKLGENSIQLIKGKEYEEEAIYLLSTYLKTNLNKNTVRVNKGFLTGECDIIYNDNIIDVKIPIDIASFRSKMEISLQYAFQLLAYKYLYDTKKDLYIAYILMPMKDNMIDIYYRNMSEHQFKKIKETQNNIEKLKLSNRIKLFKVEEYFIEHNLKFMLSRLKKAEEYYNNLNLDKCMKNISGINSI